MATFATRIMCLFLFLFLGFAVLSSADEHCILDWTSDNPSYWLELISCVEGQDVVVKSGKVSSVSLVTPVDYNNCSEHPDPETAVTVPVINGQAVFEGLEESIYLAIPSGSPFDRAWCLKGMKAWIVVLLPRGGDATRPRHPAAHVPHVGRRAPWPRRVMPRAVEWQ